MTDLAQLIAKLEAASEGSRELDEAVAKALGWRPRKRTSLGLNGRTPGNWGWVPPEPPWDWRPRLPRLSGPRTKSRSLVSLRALQAQQETSEDE